MLERSLGRVEVETQVRLALARQGRVDARTVERVVGRVNEWLDEAGGRAWH